MFSSMRFGNLEKTIYKTRVTADLFLEFRSNGEMKLNSQILSLLLVSYHFISFTEISSWEYQMRGWGWWSWEVRSVTFHPLCLLANFWTSNYCSQFLTFLLLLILVVVVVVWLFLPSMEFKFPLVSHILTIYLYICFQYY